MNSRKRVDIGLSHCCSLVVVVHLAVTLTAFPDTCVGEDEIGRAKLAWVEGELVLKMEYVNRTRKEVHFDDPRNEFDFPRNIPGVFDGLTITVYSADGTDQTDAVFRPEKPWPRPGWGSAWGSWFEPNQTTAIEVYHFVADFRVKPVKLPQPGWKLRLRAVGYTSEQLQRRYQDPDDPELVEAWATGVWPEPRPGDTTVILNTTVVVPPIPSQRGAPRLPDLSLRTWWDYPSDAKLME